MLYLASSVVLFWVGSVCASTISLVVPGFDPQPLSAEVVGVGANGETTYLLLPGQPTGTWVSQPAAFTGTATLVEDATNVVFDYVNSALSIKESCTLVGGLADCLVGLNGQTTATAQDTATPLLIQGGGTVTLASATSLQTASVTPAPGSSVPGSSATQSGASPTASSSKVASSGERARPAVAIVGVVLLVISAVVG